MKADVSGTTYCLWGGRAGSFSAQLGACTFRANANMQAQRGGPRCGGTALFCEHATRTVVMHTHTEHNGDERVGHVQRAGHTRLPPPAMPPVQQPNMLAPNMPSAPIPLTPAPPRHGRTMTVLLPQAGEAEWREQPGLAACMDMALCRELAPTIAQRLTVLHCKQPDKDESTGGGEQPLRCGMPDLGAQQGARSSQQGRSRARQGAQMPQQQAVAGLAHA